MNWGCPIPARPPPHPLVLSERQVNKLVRPQEQETGNHQLSLPVLDSGKDKEQCTATDEGWEVKSLL